ncbi:MAG: hypothetical protein KR126chlam2_00095 [Chlamydiae bacterium]|nr:hypothetical protein [Chlamydiota bacterium]
MSKVVSESSLQPPRWYQDKTTVALSVSLVALSLICVFGAVYGQWYHVGIASVSLLSATAGVTFLAAFLPPLFLHYSRKKENPPKPNSEIEETPLVLVELEETGSEEQSSDEPPDNAQLPVSLDIFTPSLEASPHSPRAPSLGTLKAAARTVSTSRIKEEEPSEPSRELQFLSSVRRGSLSARKWLQQGGVELVNTVDENGDTPLHMAAREDGLDTMREDLLPFNPQLNVKNNESETALHIAARLGNFEVVRVLVLAGADANVVNEEGETPLFVAVKSREFDVACALLHENDQIEVDAPNQNGDTALHLAASLKMKLFVYLLILYEASPNAQNNQRYTPFHLAAKRHDMVTIMLFQHLAGTILDYTIKDEDDRPALHYLPPSATLGRAGDSLTKILSSFQAKAGRVVRSINEFDNRDEKT